MIDACEIRLAMLSDADRIAVMSRDFIEHGLGWSWDAARVARRIRQRETNVVVAETGAELVGFGLMQYLDDQAHLLLFGVSRSIGAGHWVRAARVVETCATTPVSIDFPWNIE
jgi:ribosomal-protein-alanine N-acetyltransferase